VADVGAQLAGRFDMDRAGAGVRTLSSEKERRVALEILAKLLAEPEFPASILEREKVRVVGGLKESNTQPDTIAARTFSRLVYPTHPYGLRSAGEVDTVQRITRDDVVAFYHNHYAAERAVVAITGDVSRDEAAAIAESLTARMPAGTPGIVTLPPVQGPAKAQVEWVAHHAAQSHILTGLPGVRRNDPDYFALFVGNHILGGGGFVSRITEEVRTKRGLAYSAYSTFTPMLREGPFVVGMQTKGEQARAALDVVNKTLAEFVAKGPTAKELDLAKKNIIGGFPLRIDSNRKIHEYSAVIGFYRLPLTYLDDFVKNVERVTAEDVRGAFQRKVKLDKMITVIVGQPSEKSAAVDAR
jgi:zinc protease